MKTLEQGHDKLQKIMDEIRESTLEPAKKEAANIVSEAHLRAKEIVIAAEKESTRLIQAARGVIEQEQNVFNSTLTQGVRQSLDALRQEIEHKLFNDQLKRLVTNGTKDPQIVAKLINCIVNAIEKEGISADISAIIPKHIPENQLNLILAENILKQLREHSVEVGNFSGGAQIKLHDKGLTIDISDSAIQELLSRYVRKDFRKLIFLNKQ